MATFFFFFAKVDPCKQTSLKSHPFNYYIALAASHSNELSRMSSISQMSLYADKTQVSDREEIVGSIWLPLPFRDPYYFCDD